MSVTNRYCWALVCLLTLSAVADVQAQRVDYPNKPVQVIADSAAGSTPDVALRFVTDRLGQLWGQQVLVVNKPGGGGRRAPKAAADADADRTTRAQRG